MILETKVEGLERDLSLEQGYLEELLNENEELFERLEFIISNRLDMIL